MPDALTRTSESRSRWLLWAHVALAVFIVLTYALLQLDAHVDRPLVAVVTSLSTLVGSAWGALLFYVGLFSDKERAIKLSKRFPRVLLRRPALLWASTAVLACVEGVLIRELLWFRAVGLQAAEPVNVVLSDTIGQPVTLGTIQKGDCSKATNWVRLSAGEHKLAFVRPNGGEAIAARVILVPPLWSGPSPVVDCISSPGDFDALG